MSTSSINNTFKYALTKATLDTYRQLVKTGFNHDTAMAQLKSLYEWNTKILLDDINNTNKEW